MSPKDQEYWDKRLDRLEERLNAYHEQTITNTADISWTRGAVKTMFTFFGTIITGILVSLFGVK